MEFLNSAMQSSKLQRNSSIIDEKEVYRQLQAGLLKKELGRINASRMSDVLLLKNLVSEGESSAKNLLKQVIKECSLREESRAAREEQLFSLQDHAGGTDEHDRGKQQMKLYMQQCISAAHKIHDMSLGANKEWPELPIGQLPQAEPSQPFLGPPGKLRSVHKQQRPDRPWRNSPRNIPPTPPSRSANSRNDNSSRGTIRESRKEPQDAAPQDKPAYYDKPLPPASVSHNSGSRGTETIPNSSSSGCLQHLKDLCRPLQGVSVYLPGESRERAFLTQDNTDWHLALIIAMISARKIQV